MTDIVDEARQKAKDWAVGKLIAAEKEIERLRDVIKAQGAEIDRVCAMALADKDEIEQLHLLYREKRLQHRRQQVTTDD